MTSSVQTVHSLIQVRMHLCSYIGGSRYSRGDVRMNDAKCQWARRKWRSRLNGEIHRQRGDKDLSCGASPSQPSHFRKPGVRAPLHRARAADHMPRAKMASKVRFPWPTKPRNLQKFPSHSTDGTQRRQTKRWSEEETRIFERGVAEYGWGCWSSIASSPLLRRTPNQVKVRVPT